MLKVRIYYSMLLIGCFCFYMLYADHLSFILLAIFMILPIILYIINFIATKTVSITFHVEGTISEQNVGRPFHIDVENQSSFPIGGAKIYLTYTNAFSKETLRNIIHIPICADNITKVKTFINSKHVGKITVQSKKVVFYDMLKLTSISKKLSLDETFYVLPQIEDIYIDVHNKDAYDEESNLYSQKKANVNHSEIIDYHEYMQGDSIKKINWKLSSRLNTLMVKEFAEPISHAALILYEQTLHPQKQATLEQIDLGLQTVYSIMQWLYTNNIGHKLAWFDDSSNVLNEVAIRSEEDKIAALQQIEDSKFYQQPKAITTILKGIQEHSYSNIFYITSALDYEAAGLLADLCAFGKLNVIAIQKDKEQLEEAIDTLFHERDVHCVVITKHNLQQELQNLIT